MKQSIKFHHTPLEIAKDIIKQVNYSKDDLVLEPFKGDGAFYNQLINCNKDYCEIDDGKDFFNYTKKVDWIISNPPFKILINNELKNGLIPIIDHSINITTKGFGYLVNNNLFNSLTVNRLNNWQDKGFVVSYIKVYEIKKWFGRWFFILFEKNKKSILDFNENNNTLYSKKSSSLYS